MDGSPLQRNDSASHRSTAACGECSSVDVTSNLLDLDDHKFSGLQRCKADFDVDDAQIYVILRRRGAIALNEIGVPRGSTLERSFAEHALHEGTDIQPNLSPQWFIVGFKDNPLRAAVEAFFANL